MVKPLLLKGLSDYIGWFIDPLLASVYERHIEAFAFQKYEHSEYIINAFDFAFALETTRAKRVP